MSITNSPFVWYDNGIKHLHWDSLLSDDIRVALCTVGYTPNSATDEYYDVSITNEHITGSGYTIGGFALASKTLTEPNPGQWVFASANPVWTVSGSNLIVRLYVVYNNTPSSNKPLLGFGYCNYNGGSPLDVTTAVGFSYTLTVPTTGWFSSIKLDGV